MLIKMLIALICTSLTLVSLLSSDAEAELLKYVDDQGVSYYVDNLDKVPAAYKDSIISSDSFPKISKVTPKSGAMYQTRKPSKKLEVFVADWCGYCKALEKELKKDGIKYTRYNVETSRIGQKLWEKLGGGVPFSRVNGKQIIRGYAPDKIKQALAKTK